MNHFDNLLDLISKDTVGVFWFKNEKMQKEDSLTRVFNYLVDNRLDDFLDYSKENDLDIESNSNFFVSKSFDSSIIISNYSTSIKFTSESLKSFEMILEKVNKSEKKNILIVHPKEFKVPDVIKKSRFEETFYTY